MRTQKYVKYMTAGGKKNLVCEITLPEFQVNFLYEKFEETKEVIRRTDNTIAKKQIRQTPLKQA